MKLMMKLKKYFKSLLKSFKDEVLDSCLFSMLMSYFMLMGFLKLMYKNLVSIDKVNMEMFIMLLNMLTNNLKDFGVMVFMCAYKVYVSCTTCVMQMMMYLIICMMMLIFMNV